MIFMMEGRFIRRFWGDFKSRTINRKRFADSRFPTTVGLQYCLLSQLDGAAACPNFLRCDHIATFRVVV